MSGRRIDLVRVLGYGAAAVTFVCGVGALVAADYYETVDGSLTVHAALASLPVYALVIGLTRLVARHSTTVRSVFWLLAVLGLIAAPGFVVAVAYTLNAELDESARMRQVQLLEKGRERSSKSTFSYAVIAPWPPLTEPLTMGLQGPTYDRLPTSGPIRARIGEGWLGYVWVDDLWPAEGGPTEGERGGALQ
jgi:hypothetical protein